MVWECASPHSLVGGHVVTLLLGKVMLIKCVVNLQVEVSLLCFSWLSARG